MNDCFFVNIYINDRLGISSLNLKCVVRYVMILVVDPNNGQINDGNIRDL